MKKLRKIKEMQISKKNDEYAYIIGFVDYHLNQFYKHMHNELREHHNFDMELGLCIKHWKDIKFIICEELAENIEWDSVIKKALDSYSFDDILQAKEIANEPFVIAYKEGYQDGDILTIEEAREVTEKLECILLTSNSKKSALEYALSTAISKKSAKIRKR